MITLYIGGFEKIGGIEKFARDLMLGIASDFPDRQMIYWGRKEAHLPLVQEIRESGCKIKRSPLRWGCRWRMPDYLLLARSLPFVRSSAVVIFKKSPSIVILRFLKWTCLRKNKNCRFVCVTPYRPRELWTKSPATEAHLNLFDCILVQSHEWEQDLVDLGFVGKIASIPLFPPPLVPLAPLPLHLGSSVVKLGFLGRLEDQKNIPFMLDVFGRLQGLNPNQYELHIYGDGSLREWLLARLKTMPSALIHFHGSVANEQVGNAIDTCDLFLITSKTEGQCIVALEVLARGRPLAATPVGALPDILADASLGSLGDPESPERFAQAVHEIAQKIQTRSITPESVRQAYEIKFSPGVVRQGYITILHELLSGCAPY